MNKLIQAARDVLDTVGKSAYVAEMGDKELQAMSALTQALTEAEQRPSYDELVEALRRSVSVLSGARDGEEEISVDFVCDMSALLARIPTKGA